MVGRVSFVRNKRERTYVTSDIGLTIVEDLRYSKGCISRQCSL